VAGNSVVMLTHQASAPETMTHVPRALSTVSTSLWSRLRQNDVRQWLVSSDRRHSIYVRGKTQTIKQTGCCSQVTAATVVLCTTVIWWCFSWTSTASVRPSTLSTLKLRLTTHQWVTWKSPRSRTSTNASLVTRSNTASSLVCRTTPQRG